MVGYERVNLKLSNQQIKKLKETVKNNNGTTLRIGNKNFNKADLLHELFLTQTQIYKLRGKVENNMSTDIKLSKAQINKLIKEGGALGSILARFLPKLIIIIKLSLGLITSVFSLSFSLSFEIIIKLQQETKIRKKKHNKLLYSAKNKLDWIEMLISNSISDGIISHDEFLEILKEKKGYDGLKNEDKIENA